MNSDASCGAKKTKYGSGIYNMKVNELRTLVKQIYQEEKKTLPSHISKINRSQLCFLLKKTDGGQHLINQSVSPIINESKDCLNLGGLSNINSSCYMDSILVALLYQPNQYINNHILYVDLSSLNISSELVDLTNRIQLTLRLIAEGIRSSEISQCTNLRKLFDEYQKKSNEVLIKKGKKPNKLTNWLTAQKSASNVLSMLEKIFHIKQDAIISFKVMGGNLGAPDEITINENRSSDVIIPISSALLHEYDLKSQIYELKNSINQHNTIYFDEKNLYKHKYQIKKEIQSLIQAPLLIFNVDRNYLGNKPSTTVMPPQNIILPGLNPPKSQHKLKLSAILIHDGYSPSSGHFRAYIRCGTNWYHYNDLGYNKLELKGNFKEAILKDDYLLKNSTQFIYY